MEATAETAVKGTHRELFERSALTPRQVAIVEALVEGLSYAEIAGRLAISYHTVHSHIKAIHRKLGVHSTGRLVALVRSTEQN
jgi:DNA-binding CsgD family transcriptional regulator